MGLKVWWVDMRGGYRDAVSFETDVIDEDSGRKVGFVISERSPAARHISLFGGKYKASFTSSASRDECDAFAKGVEAVLNHMTNANEDKSESEAVAYREAS